MDDLKRNGASLIMARRELFNFARSKVSLHKRVYKIISDN